jgi:DNA-binding Xre family transcriptional regulator
MTVDKMRLYEAFDQMLVTLDIQAQDLCNRTNISKSRVSSFRNGVKANMGTDFLDALLDAAESINPRAREVFATYIGGKGKLIEDMTLAEKGKLMMAIGKSIQTSKNTDSESVKTA